jgi:hypothetical protein
MKVNIKRDFIKIAIAILLIINLIVIGNLPFAPKFIKELVVGFEGTVAAATADYVCDGTDDHTEINNAIQALPAAGGKVILLAGTYDIGASILIDADNIRLEGMGHEATILKLSNSANVDVIQVDSAVNEMLEAVELVDFAIDGNRNNNTSGDGVWVATCNEFYASNLHITDIDDNGMLFEKSGTAEGHHCLIERVQIYRCDEAGIKLNENPDESAFAHIIIRNVGTYQIEVIGTDKLHFLSCHLGGTNGGSGYACMKIYYCNYVAVGGTTWISNMSSDSYGIDISSSASAETGDTLISDVIFKRNNVSSTHDGIYIHTNGQNVEDTQIVGCRIEMYRYGVNIADSSVQNTTVVGCNFTGGSGERPSVIDNGRFSVIKGNNSSSMIYEKDHSYMKNTSGGTMTIGEVVIWKAVANGYEFDDTTTQGDDKVLGIIASGSISNNNWGYVQTIGKTVSLKVNGTDDIAIGDFICTYTSSGIGAKAGSGDMAFAIALEAYTSNDSNGVIDALLVTPRKI